VTGDGGAHERHHHARPRLRRGEEARGIAVSELFGVLSTAGGVIVTALLDGTILAFDDQTLTELWRINVGSGFNAPPMTYSVNGKQYIAIASGLCCAGNSPDTFRNGRQRLSRIPELRGQGNTTMVFVFAL